MPCNEPTNQEACFCAIPETHLKVILPADIFPSPFPNHVHLRTQVTFGWGIPYSTGWKIRDCESHFSVRNSIFTGTCMGLHEQTRTRIEECLRERVFSGQLPKGSAINPYRISEDCLVDPRTAQAHMPGLIGLEVEGMNFRGKVKNLNESAGPWVIIDPPNDKWIDRASKARKHDHDSTKIIAGLVTVSLSLLAWGLSGPVSERSIFTCAHCGTQIDTTDWNESGFSCPKCSEQYVRQGS